MNAHFTSSSSRKSRKTRITSWMLQLLAAAAFIAAGSAKLAAIPMMVDLFDKIGFGQWLRIFTGIVEITGGLALLIPATAAYGGVVLACTMAVGVMTHLLIIGGNPAPAIMLLIMTASIAYLRRESFLIFSGKK
ncbi:DoxX family protein [Dickeya zeae]|uniref:DoxX family protein n=1 Tax=Dickeya zeae TaxID=204042 RepID=A0AAE6YZ44_9GAMM|nr:DoxX family protein [Dickeya zeae]QIZ50523.1 DoxX family protein [Dickeya zeae]